MRIAITTDRGYDSVGALRAHGFANQLIAAGHEVLLLLAGLADTTSGLEKEPRYLVRELHFVDGVLEPTLCRLIEAFDPQIVHLWTPRHLSARAGLEVWSRSEARLVIHYEEDAENAPGAGGPKCAFGRGDLSLYRTFWLGGQEEAEDLEKLADDGNREFFRRTVEKPQVWPWVHPLLSSVVEKLAVGRTASTPACGSWLNRRFPQPVRTLYPGVDHERFSVQRDPSLVRSLGLDGRTVLLYSGSTAAFDDFPRYVEALPAVVGDHPEIVAVRLGEEADGQITPVRVAELGLEDHVLLTGPIPSSRAPRYLALADLFLGPTTATHFDARRLPPEVPHYMASGRPILMSDVGVASELEDGTEVIKIPGSFRREIEAGLHRALELRSSWPAMGRRLQARSEKLFDGRLNTEHLVSFYQELLRGPQEGRAEGVDPGDDVRVSEPTSFLGVEAPPIAEPKESLDLDSLGTLASEALSELASGMSPEERELVHYTRRLETEIARLRGRASKHSRLKRMVGLFKNIPGAKTLWRTLVRWSSKS